MMSDQLANSHFTASMLSELYLTKTLYQRKYVIIVLIDVRITRRNSDANYSNTHHQHFRNFINADKAVDKF